MFFRPRADGGISGLSSISASFVGPTTRRLSCLTLRFICRDQPQYVFRILIGHVERPASSGSTQRLPRSSGDVSGANFRLSRQVGCVPRRTSLTSGSVSCLGHKMWGWPVSWSSVTPNFEHAPPKRSRSAHRLRDHSKTGTRRISLAAYQIYAKLILRDGGALSWAGMSAHFRPAEVPRAAKAHLPALAAVPSLPRRIDQVLPGSCLQPTGERPGRSSNTRPPPRPRAPGTTCSRRWSPIDQIVHRPSVAAVARPTPWTIAGGRG